ncbi:unnamed protein product [Lota lota]
MPLGFMGDMTSLSTSYRPAVQLTGLIASRIRDTETGFQNNSWPSVRRKQTEPDSGPLMTWPLIRRLLREQARGRGKVTKHNASLFHMVKGTAI